MRVIVAGTRSFNDYNLLKKVLNNKLKKYNDLTILCGCAQGADTLGKRWTKENGYKVEEYPAKWDDFGKKAGYIRNEKMAKNADALIAFWDEKSKGTKHMINFATEYNLNIKVIKYKNKSKIYLSSLSKSKNLPDNVIKLFIARQPIKNMGKYDLKHVTELAPSKELLYDYKGDKITWKEYVDLYREEMRSINARKMLNKIIDYLDMCNDIALICYCGSSSNCHRNIVGNYFKEIGKEVINFE
jgi:uncharacterized protein YeaO (DUF488 family)